MFKECIWASAGTNQREYIYISYAHACPLWFVCSQFVHAPAATPASERTNSRTHRQTHTKEAYMQIVINSLIHHFLIEYITTAARTAKQKRKRKYCRKCVMLIRGVARLRSRTYINSDIMRRNVIHIRIYGKRARIHQTPMCRTIMLNSFAPRSFHIYIYIQIARHSAEYCRI